METSQAEVIKKCRKDMQKERIIKSVLCGMAVGFSVLFVLAFITWIFEFKGLWLSVGLGVAAWAVAAVVFYFVVFKITDMAVMQRLDRAGLDERMVTMYELQGDDSYMAQRQRADASAAFSAAVKMSGGRLINTQIATAVICAVSIACPIGTGFAVVTALSDYGVIPTLYELCSGNGGLENGSTAPTYTVTYEAGGVENGGLLIDLTSVRQSAEGDDTSDEVTFVRQSIVAGGTSVVKFQPAVESNGYIYYLAKMVDGDGNEYYPSGNEFVFADVRKSMAFTAVFEMEYVGEEGMMNYYYNPDDQNEFGDNRDNNGNGDKNDDNKPSSGDEPGGGGPPSPGNSSDDDTIIDGETPYDEDYDYYYALAMDMLANGTDGYPPELVSMLEGYFGILL